MEREALVYVGGTWSEERSGSNPSVSVFAVHCLCITYYDNILASIH